MACKHHWQRAALFSAIGVLLAAVSGPAPAQQAAPVRVGDPAPLDPPPPGAIGAPAVGAVAAGSANVFVEGSPAARGGDPVLCNTEIPNPGTIVPAPATVYINGQPAARDRDAVAGCVDQWLIPGPIGPIPIVQAVGGEVRATAKTVGMGP